MEDIGVATTSETQSFRAYYQSPIGWVEIVGTRDQILWLKFVDRRQTAGTHLTPGLKKCVEQIDAYFRGIRKKFSVDLLLRGTDFQQSVWHQLQKIPHGRTASYADIARAIGKPQACRAVGMANGKNPISIIVPCHRIIGSDGTLTGYGGGLWRKEWLLKHENAAVF